MARSMQARSRFARRRGVLLLVVMAVLVMFLVITLTYVLVASKARSVGKALGHIDKSGDPPNFLLDECAMLLFRGTNDPHCPFATWSLLEGVYGNVSFRGAVSGVNNAVAGGQFLTIGSGASNLTVSPGNTANYFKGCVLTMLTGNCVGQSTRIVASQSGQVTVMRFKADAGLLDPSVNDTFLVNGRAYCGMGRGYNTVTAGSAGAPALNAVDPNNWLYALLPNTTTFQSNTTGGLSYTDPAGPGGDNVPYTAYDYQSYYLGLVTHQPQPNKVIPPVLPSFHHPELCNYWSSQSGNVNLLRKILFRPNAIDHPNFTASVNPSFSAASATGPYDVDNLGNGTPESIWIDPGFPVMVARDGRTYKVLVAPLILDMDGRLNVNAHGSTAQLDPNYQQSVANAGISSSDCKGLAGLVGGGAAQLSIGQGYGPADVNLTAMFTTAEIQNLLVGNAGNALQGRYGVYNSPIAGRALAAWKFFEYPPNDWRGSPLTSFGTPPDMWGHRLVGLDWRGQPLFLAPGSGNSPATGTSTVIPLNENSNYWTMEVFDPNGQLDNPYGFDLSLRAIRPGRQVPGGNGTSAPYGFNNPFTVGELERILRMNDIDARSLPPRLYALLTSMQTGSAKMSADPWRSQSITTDSSDLPSPSTLAPTGFRSQLASNGYRAFGVTDLVRAKLQNTGVAAANMDVEIANIIAPELIAGVRMDINQPFGNGRYDSNKNYNNGNYGVDAAPLAGSAAADAATETVNSPQPQMPLPAPANTNIWPSEFPGSVALSTPNGLSTIDPLLKGTYLSQGCKARQLMARHLYSLMMLFADSGFVGWTTETGLSQQQQQQLTSRRVAQWAINAVCFRDSTSIMTPFVYHADIFQPGYAGWTTDGDPGNPANQAVSGSMLTANNIGIVWGCKPPDLVMTETLAFHDRRTADTNWDDGTHHAKIADKPPDDGGTSGTPNNDQTRVPQGSLFVELYCPRNANNPVAPGDLYVMNNGQWNLNLGAMAPNDSQGNPWPVWRMAIGQSTNPNNAASSNGKPAYSVMKQLQNHPDTTTLEPGAMSLFPTNDPVGAPNIPIERVVWLGSTPPPAASRANVYYNQNSAVNSLLPLDSYAVVGPRASTAIGSDNVAGQPPYGTETNSQRITISPAANFGVKGASGAANFPNNTDIKQPIGIICAADPPTTWTKHAQGSIGLSVTEPLPGGAAYYPEPTVPNSPPTGDPSGNGLVEAYGDLTQKDATKYFLDQPLESAGNTAPAAKTYPVVADNIIATHTWNDYKTVFLQRLADPTSPYDQFRNPYITVDWMPIDVTVFNGEQPPQNDPDDPSGKGAQVQFAARQRGGSDPKNLVLPLSYNLWAPESKANPLPLPAIAAYGGGGAVFSAQLMHSLGYLNLAFGPGFKSSTPPPAPQYLGDPPHPFPWITWNARPYASLTELLNVPASTPERLTFEFSGPGVTTPAVGTAYGTDPYKIPAVTPAPDARAPFGHLLNFFATTDTTFALSQASNFYRALEYMQVPSRFVGTETILNPNTFNANGSGGAATQFFLPPYNVVSNYRDPGRINLNTLTSQEGAAALFSGLPTTITSQWFDSRRGDGASNGNVIPASGTGANGMPTFFNCPFRDPAGADCVPLAGMMQRGVDVTLLRSHPPGTGTKPLFQNDPTGAVQDYNDSPRNAYFAYQNLERVSNLVTTRSNVFGVWLTIGYFEAFPNTAGIDAGHPDGYQLGAELGSSTGDIERHRAFYIFDRSIPVGFERGQNHNVNRAILLKRYIE